MQSGWLGEGNTHTPTLYREGVLVSLVYPSRSLEASLIIIIVVVVVFIFSYVFLLLLLVVCVVVGCLCCVLLRFLCVSSGV